MCLLVAGLFGAGLLVWHVAALLLAITIGPGAPALPFPIASQLEVLEVAVVTLAVTFVGSAVCRPTQGQLDSSLLLQLGTGLVALALSYRFVALLVLLGIIACRSRQSERRRLAAWRMWAAVLLVCLAPIDISLRATVGSPRPRLVRTANCELSSRMSELNNASSIVCVAGGTPLYSEPRWVLVW